jgi:DNA-binding response OmpR family regulator
MKSILLADDETTICSAFARTLEGFGYQIEMAHSVESTLRRVEHEHFDAVLVEFNLRSEQGAHPRAGNGLQLVRQLRTSQVALPVLMFTVMEGELYETASFDAGADDFILKTIPIRSLVARLRAHLRGATGHSTRTRHPA